MASPLGSEDDVFEKLRSGQSSKQQAQRKKEIEQRKREQEEQAAKGLEKFIVENSTFPATLSSIRILGANNTRRGFLERIFSPLINYGEEDLPTLAETLQGLSRGMDKLERLDIFHSPISLFIDKSSKVDPNTTFTDIEAFISVREKGRVRLKSGTDVGNAEGAAYADVLWRNIFGGAETLNLHASFGTRTRSAYSVGFGTPILSNPDFRWEACGFASSTQKFWSSHEELLRGGQTKLKWALENGSLHEFGYSGVWRQVTGLAEKASPVVRGDAGDSVKSSISHVWTLDRRGKTFLPTSGYFARTTSEVAGWGPLQGDVAFWKSEVETQGAVSVPVPGIKGDSGVSFTTGLRAGLLYPLTLGGESQPRPSRINDRFTLGGPTDVRGFRVAGIGPHNGKDAVGGDLYVAGGANLLLPIPKVGVESGLRLQAYVNCGRLLAFNNLGVKDKVDSKTVQKTVYKSIAELANGLPSTAVGVGLVYASSVARFELNFTLPMIAREGEQTRKGLQLGVGVEFM